MKRFSADIAFQDQDDYAFFQVGVGEGMECSMSPLGTAKYSSLNNISLGYARFDLNGERVGMSPGLYHVGQMLGLPNFILIENKSESFTDWIATKDDEYFLNEDIHGFDDILKDYRNSLKTENLST